MIKKGWLLFLAVLLTAGFAGTSYAASSVTLSGQVRLRGEYRDNADWTDATSDGASSVTQRTRLTANAKVNDKVSAKITLQDTRIWGSEASTATTGNDTQAVDLKEGYFQVALNPCISLKAGRQVIAKGDQRILGGLEWSNFSRSHDGFALILTKDVATVTAAWLKTTETNSTAATATDNDTDHYLVYAEIKAIENNQIDAYAILRRNGSTSFKPESLWTVGARVAGKVPAANVDYTVEVPLQFGDTGTQTAGSDNSYAGWAAFLKAGYTVPGANKIRLGVEYDMWSGDDQVTAGGDRDDYVNLGLGTDHAHYGYMDIMNPGKSGTKGNSLWGLNVKANIIPDLSVYAAYWNSTLDEVATGASDNAGSEINLVATYKVAGGTKVQAGYGNYSPDTGTPGATTANQDNQDWAYLMFISNF